MRESKVGVAFALLAAMVALSAFAPAAQAGGRCTAVGEIYHYRTIWYEISGGRCTSKQHKMVVSGNVYGDKAFYEIRKTCYDTKVCLEQSPTFKNPRGTYTYTLAVVFGWKHHWYTMPHYRGIKKRYRF